MIGERPLDVLAVGDLFIDLVMSGFPSWPQLGEECFATRFRRDAGGGAAISACGLSKLGVRVGVLGVVGHQDGVWLLERLREHGVLTSDTRLSRSEPTATTVCVSGPDDRAYFTYAGANGELPDLLLETVRTGGFSKARHVHLACAPSPSVLTGLLGSLTEAGCTVSMDVGWHPQWLTDHRCASALSEVNIFFPNLREAGLMTGETDPQRILQALQRGGFKNVALKLGPGGAALLCEGEVIFQKSDSVEPTDTTGAGDCFDAGFLFAWLRGDDPSLCLRTGSLCGALSTRELGGIAGFPTKMELEAALCTVK